MNKTSESVKREIVVNAPLNVVWEALTKPEHLNRWYTKEAEIDFRVGGRGYMNHGWGSTTEGTFTEIDPMKRFVLKSLDGNFTTITSLLEVSEGIKVGIEYQSNFLNEMSRASKENMLFGTGQFLENLKSVYETSKDIRGELWKTWIGITHATNEDRSGTKVIHVKKGSVAETAGIRPEDIIKKIDQDVINGYESFERVINKKIINQPVTLTIERNHEKFEVNCLIDSYPVSY